MFNFARRAIATVPTLETASSCYSSHLPHWSRSTTVPTSGTPTTSSPPSSSASHSTACSACSSLIPQALNAPGTSTASGITGSSVASSVLATASPSGVRSPK
ncbi:hypothetical protein FS837_009313, partial [Tulasnella sp. UAMH 9824]